MTQLVCHPSPETLDASCARLSPRISGEEALQATQFKKSAAKEQRCDVCVFKDLFESQFWDKL